MGPLHGRASVLCVLERDRCSERDSISEQEWRCLVLQDTAPSCPCPGCACSSQAAALLWLMLKPPTSAASRASRAPLCMRGSCSLCRGLTAWRLGCPLLPGSPHGNAVTLPGVCLLQVHLVQPPAQAQPPKAGCPGLWTFEYWRLHKVPEQQCMHIYT